MQSSLVPSTFSPPISSLWHSPRSTTSLSAPQNITPCGTVTRNEECGSIATETHLTQSGPSIEVSQEKAIEELEEIPLEKNTKEDLHCTPTMRTRYRSSLGQINWLQSRTQFQCCYMFSRCASRAASPTIGDVNALYKLARQLKSQPVKLQFWPLTRPLRTIGCPDASYRNNEDGSSQRGMTVFLA